MPGAPRAPKGEIDVSVLRVAQVEVGSFLWTPGWADNIRFNIVVKRTWIEEEQGSLFGEGHWDYYGKATTMP